MAYSENSRTESEKFFLTPVKLKKRRCRVGLQASDYRIPKRSIFQIFIQKINVLVRRMLSCIFGGATHSISIEAEVPNPQGELKRIRPNSIRLERIVSGGKKNFLGTLNLF